MILISDCYEKAQPIADGTIPGMVVLGSMRKKDMRSKYEEQVSKK